MVAFRDVLAIARLRRVLASWLLFNSAEWAIWVAILVYAYAATGPSSVALVAVAQLVPAALGAPLTARLADRFAPERALALAYAVIGLAMVATGVAMVTRMPPILVYVLAAAVVVAYTSVRPIQITILPGLVGRAEQLTAANALSTILEGAGVLIGPLLCGVLVALASPAVVYLGGGVATLAGAGLVAGLAVRAGTAPSRPRTARPTIADADATPGSGPAGGLRTALADPARALAIGLLATRFGVAAALDVLIVLAAIELLGMGQAGAGYLSAAIGLGWVLGGASTLVIVGRRRLTPLVPLGGVIWAVPVVGVAVLARPEAALLGLVVAGIGLAVVDVAIRTVLQRLVATDQLAGVFGVAESASMAGAASGALAAGALVAVIGLIPTIVVAGILLPLVALAAMRRIGQGEATVRIPFREIALLRRIPMFAPVPAPALEAAAAALIPVAVASGSVVIREGDIGDRFWVVDTGEVRVDQDGHEIGRLGAGASFGELALVRDIPRTASVVAVTDVDLLALEREAFLLTLTASPRAANEASRVAAAFLAHDGAAAAPAAATTADARPEHAPVAPTMAADTDRPPEPPR